MAFVVKKKPADRNDILAALSGKTAKPKKGFKLSVQEPTKELVGKPLTPAQRKRVENYEKTLPAAKPAKTELRVSLVEKVKIVEPKPKVTKVTVTTPMPVEERLPLDPTKIKWEHSGRGVAACGFVIPGSRDGSQREDGGVRPIHVWGEMRSPRSGRFGTREFDADHLEKVMGEGFPHLRERTKARESVLPAVQQLGLLSGLSWRVSLL